MDAATTTTTTTTTTPLPRSVSFEDVGGALSVDAIAARASAKRTDAPKPAAAYLPPVDTQPPPPPPKKETLLPPEMAVAATKAAGIDVDSDTVRAASQVNHAAGTSFLGSLGRSLGFSSAPSGQTATTATPTTSTPRTSRRTATAADPKLASPSSEDPHKRSICIRRLRGYSKVKQLTDVYRELVPSNFASLPLVRLEELCCTLDKEMGYNNEGKYLRGVFVGALAAYERYGMQYAPEPYNAAHGVAMIASDQLNQEGSELDDAMTRLSLLHLGTLETNAYMQLTFAAFSLIEQVGKYNLQQRPNPEQQAPGEDPSTAGLF